MNAVPAAPAAAFLATGRKRGEQPAPAPAPGPAPMPGPSGPPCSNPKVHVAFAPGKLIKVKRAALLALRQPSSPALGPPPRTTIVKVSIFDKPNNMQDDIAMAQTTLNNAVANGQLLGDLN